MRHANHHSDTPITDTVNQGMLVGSSVFILTESVLSTLSMM